MTNYLKTIRKMDTCLPTNKNMDIYRDAVKPATASGKWQKYPNRKWKDQKIQLVTDPEPLWESDASKENVPLNVCMVHDKKTDKFFTLICA